ncbi:MAG TPA: DUF4192 domain-containing protein, partial [Micromonosporaceae bacterium]
AELEVVDALRVADGRYWSYTCDDPQCCSPEGTRYDVTTSEIAAAATFAGQVALPDRDALVQQVAPVTGAARAAMRRATEAAFERLDALLDGRSPMDPAGRRRVRKAGEAAVREAMERHRGGGHLTDDEVAWLGLLLTHIPVRDYAWERIGVEEWQVGLWLDVVRRVEPDLVAAPAGLLAFAAWRSGQGALAGVAVERARSAAPDYSMAQLMDEVLQKGIPPSALEGWPYADRGRRPQRNRRRRARRRRSNGGGRPTKVVLTEGSDHERGPGSDPARRAHHRRSSREGGAGVAGLRAGARRGSADASGRGTH